MKIRDGNFANGWFMCRPWLADYDAAWRQRTPCRNATPIPPTLVNCLSTLLSSSFPYYTLTVITLYLTMAEDGKIEKLEKDFAPVVDATIPEAEGLAKVRRT